MHTNKQKKNISNQIEIIRDIRDLSERFARNQLKKTAFVVWKKQLMISR